MNWWRAPRSSSSTNWRPANAFAENVHIPSNPCTPFENNEPPRIDDFGEGAEEEDDETMLFNRWHEAYVTPATYRTALATKGTQLLRRSLKQLSGSRPGWDKMPKMGSG